MDADLPGRMLSVHEVERRLGFAPAPQETLSDTCSICFDALGMRAWRELTCGHRYHEGCILSWVEWAHQPACPLCRADIEASALLEFESGFLLFESELKAFGLARSSSGGHLRAALAGAEHCRRRLFDAAVLRFRRLLGTSHGIEDPAWLEELQIVFRVLLRQLEGLRDVLQRRRSVDVQVPELLLPGLRLDVELLGLLAEQLLRLHTLLRWLAAGCAATPGVGEADWCGGSVCGELRTHLGHVDRICGVYNKALRRLSLETLSLATSGAAG